MTQVNPISAIALAAGLVALALPASAEHGRDRDRDRDWRGGRASAVLYTDAGFSGEGVRIDGAEPDLARFGFNDRASSIAIRSGVWEVCVDGNFRGRCEIIDTSVSRLGEYRLNDNVSSIRPVNYGGGGRPGGWGAGLVLFPDANQRGDGLELNQDVPDLGAYRFNDRASSFLVSRGTWLVCEDANYRGRCEVLTAGAGNLKPIRMNDNITSIRRYDGRGR
ncbi:MAG TPA: beta/gamma crystallin-related protein [Hyphomonas sp.]|nr:beta/gamma crystallin-related protein [Hyphomonas sp.]